MRQSFTLSQKEIEQAVLEFVENSGISIEGVTREDVILMFQPNATEEPFGAVVNAGEVE